MVANSPTFPTTVPGSVWWHWSRGGHSGLSRRSAAKSDLSSVALAKAEVQRSGGAAEFLSRTEGIPTVPDSRVRASVWTAAASAPLWSVRPPVVLSPNQVFPRHLRWWNQPRLASARRVFEARRGYLAQISRAPIFPSSILNLLFFLVAAFLFPLSPESVIAYRRKFLVAWPSNSQ